MGRATSSRTPSPTKSPTRSLLVSRRRALHEAVGQLLERQFADRLDEMVDRLAHHYSRTERNDKAVEYLSRFAEKAVQGYAHAEAARALEEALPHAERLPAEGRERRVLGLVVRLVTSLYFQCRLEELPRPAVPLPAEGRRARRPADRRRVLLLAGAHRALTSGVAPGSEGFAARAIEEAERAGDAHDDRQGPHRAGLGGLLHGTVRGGGRARAGGGRGARAHRGVVVAQLRPRLGGGQPHEPRGVRRRAPDRRAVAGRSGASDRTRASRATAPG